MTTQEPLDVAPTGSGANIGRSVVIVLVHGTWAQDAKWACDPTSPFRQGLEKELGVTVRYDPIEWSGVNSHAHRLRAGDELRERLRRSLQDAVGVDHVIVAHSHGGNVVGYALQDEHLRAAVRSVVCLGTPFLIAERIALHRDLYRVMRLTLAGVALIALSAWQRSTDSVAWYVAGGGLVLALPVVGLFTWAALRSGSGRLSWRALAAGWRDHERLATGLALPEVGRERLLVIRASSDEAAGALGTAQFSAWLLREAQRRLDHVMKRLDTRRTAVAPAIGLAVLLGGAVAYAGLISHQSANAVRGLAIMFLLVSGLATIGVGLLAYVMLVLSLMMHAPFGLDAMLASLRVRTSVEPAPPGFATVLQVAPLKSPASTLQHSSLYEDDGVIRDVAEWLRGRLRSPVAM